jgi:hypothetical protein
MIVRTFVGAALGVVAMSAFTLMAQDSKSQWQGIYTAEQAKRGQ